MLLTDLSLFSIMGLFILIFSGEYMLTARESETLDIIKSFIDKKGYSPTTGEIAEYLGISSRGVVYRYLKSLEKAELIDLIPSKRRNIVLRSRKASNININIVGTIAAGKPIEAISEHDELDITKLFLKPGRYALRVKGDSMIEDGIFDGDVVVCEKSNVAENNQVVVALIDGEFATLKRIRFKSPNKILLEPANKSHTVQEYDASRVNIQGVLIGLLRLNC